MLWILAALSALVLIYLTYVTNTAVVVAGSTDRVQAEALVTAGVELAAYQLTAVKEGQRPTSGTFNARVGRGRVSVTFRSEAARVDLNAAPKALLSGLMTGLGASPSDARLLCRSHPGLAGADGTGRRRSREFILSDLRIALRSRATRRSRRPRNCGWCAEFRPP